MKSLPVSLLTSVLLSGDPAQGTTALTNSSSYKSFFEVRALLNAQQKRLRVKPNQHMTRSQVSTFSSPFHE